MLSFFSNANSGVCTLTIVKPNSLAVYAASFDASRGREPPRVQKIDLVAGGEVSYRVVAEVANPGGYTRTLDGALRVQWESLDSNVVEVVSYAAGVVDLCARSAGSTKLRVLGAALSKEIEVVVAPAKANGAEVKP